MCLVVGRYAAKPRNTSTWLHQPRARRPSAAGEESAEKAPATSELNGWNGKPAGSPAARCFSRTVAPPRRKKRRVERDDEPQDPLAVLRSREQAARVAGEAPHERDHAGQEDGRREEVLAEVVEGVEPRGEDLLVEEGPPPGRLEERRQPLEDDLEVAEAQDQEAVEEDGVQEARRRVLLEPLLAERVGEHRERALAGVVGEDLVAAGARADEHPGLPEPPSHEAERAGQESEGEEGL